MIRIRLEIPQLDDITQLLRAVLAKDTKIMATVQQVKDQADKVLAAVKNESDKDDSIILLVQGNTTMIASLKQQLQDAINAGADPVALQAVLDAMTTAEQSSLANADKVVAAVNAGTT